MTDVTTKEGRDALRALARDATQGPWSARACIERRMWVHGPGVGYIVAEARPSANCATNAAYIAAASPEVVTALLDRIDSLEAERASLAAKWGAFYGDVAHNHTCDAWPHGGRDDPRCDCGLRELFVALEALP